MTDILKRIMNPASNTNDPEGNLLPETAWSEQAAKDRAQALGLDLSDNHWDVVLFVRDYYRGRGEEASAREMLNALSEEFAEDGGRRWERIGRQGRQTFGGYYHPRQDGWIYMTLTEGAPGAGLWLSQDNGREWQPFDGLPFANIQRVAFGPTEEPLMYVTTFGGSVWRGPIMPQTR